MQLFHASWILPIDGAPIRDGWVAAERGRIVALGRRRPGAGDLGPGAAAAEEVDLGSVAVLPGLVNAHTHLELSWLAGEVPSAERFADWIRTVISRRREEPPGGAEGRRRAVERAIEECHRSGTALVGEVANALATVEALAASPLHAVVCREIIGFQGGDAAALVEQARQELMAAPHAPNVRVTLGAHAPYSVSPRLFRVIKTVLADGRFAPSSVHLGESVEEIAFLAGGTGPWRSLLEQLGVWDESWTAPACGPVEYLDRLGFLDERVLCVHGVHLEDAALETLASRRATLVTCPRGNRLTGAGSPPVPAFYAAGLRVAVGTDSLASVPDLNLFSELAELRRLAPRVPASMLLASATWQGARALGWDDEFGTIAPGKRAALLAVAVPRSVADVEEYLVGGIVPEQLAWVIAERRNG